MSKATQEVAAKKPVVLTDRQKREMFIRWDTGRYTQQELADWYGCTQQAIAKLISRREELHLGEGEEATELFDALDMKNVEDSLGTIALKISRVVEKCPEKMDSLPLLNRTAKTVLDIRKQLRELPKDLRDLSIPINFEAAYKLASLIPAEKREEYMQIMRGLAQNQGQPGSDLGRVKKPEDPEDE